MHNEPGRQTFLCIAGPASIGVARGGVADGRNGPFRISLLGGSTAKWLCSLRASSSSGTVSLGGLSNGGEAMNVSALTTTAKVTIEWCAKRQNIDPILADGSRGDAARRYERMQKGGGAMVLNLTRPLFRCHLPGSRCRRSYSLAVAARARASGTQGLRGRCVARTAQDSDHHDLSGAQELRSG